MGITLIRPVAAAALLVVGASGLAASILAAPVARAADDGPADVCLEVANGVLPAGAWARIVEVVSGVVANRAALFTDPTLVTSPEPASDGDAGEASPAPMTARLEIYAGHVGATPPGVSAPCLESDFAWPVSTPT
jgi:hypothetical protein